MKIPKLPKLPKLPGLPKFPKVSKLTSLFKKKTDIDDDDELDPELHDYV